jgi:hypothetical protein
VEHEQIGRAFGAAHGKAQPVQVADPRSALGELAQGQERQAGEGG